MEEPVLHAFLRPYIFVDKWQNIQAISFKNEYFIDNF